MICLFEWNWKTNLVYNKLVYKNKLQTKYPSLTGVSLWFWQMLAKVCKKKLRISTRLDLHVENKITMCIGIMSTNKLKSTLKTFQVSNNMDYSTSNLYSGTRGKRFHDDMQYPGFLTFLLSAQLHITFKKPAWEHFTLYVTRK